MFLCSTVSRLFVFFCFGLSGTHSTHFSDSRKNISSYGKKFQVLLLESLKFVEWVPDNLKQKITNNLETIEQRHVLST